MMFWLTGSWVARVGWFRGDNCPLPHKQKQKKKKKSSPSRKTYKYIFDLPQTSLALPQLIVRVMLPSSLTFFENLLELLFGFWDFDLPYFFHGKSYNLGFWLRGINQQKYSLSVFPIEIFLISFSFPYCVFG